MNKIKNLVWFLVLGFLVLPLNFAAAAESPQAKIKKAIEFYVLQEHPEWLGFELKIELKNIDRIESMLQGLSDKADFEVIKTDSMSRSVGNVIFPVKITDKDLEKKVFIRTQVAVFANVVIAAGSIRRRQIIEPDLVKLESRDIAMLPEKYFTDVDKVIGKEAKTTIPKGSTIYEWMVKESPLVRNGDKLMIVVKGANLMVKAKGWALMDGYLGRAIRVRAENSKEILDGVLVAPDKVEVQMK